MVASCLTTTYLEEILTDLAFTNHIIQALHLPSCRYCCVTARSGTVSPLHILNRTSHKLLRSLKIFARIYSILRKQMNDLQSTLTRINYRFLSCSSQMAESETTSGLPEVLRTPCYLREQKCYEKNPR